MLITSRGDRPQEVILREKLERLHAFAEATFPEDNYRYEWWSPYVAVGKLTDVMDEIEAEWQAAGRDMRFVKNATYTERIRELAGNAAKNSSTTNEPAYRMLQVLTRLRAASSSCSCSARASGKPVGSGYLARSERTVIEGARLAAAQGFCDAAPPTKLPRRDLPVARGVAPRR